MPHPATALFLTQVLTALIAASVSILVIAAVVLAYLRVRSRSREDNARIHEELAVMERGEEFSSAVDHTPHFKTGAEAADHIAMVLQDHLWLPVLAIYAGRHGDAKLVNTLHKTSGLLGGASSGALPPFLEPSQLYSRPTVVSLSAIARERPGASADSPSANPSVEELKPQATPTEAVEQPAVEVQQVGVEQFSDSAALAQSPSSHGNGPQPDVLMLPWRGPFNWGGLIVAGTQAGITFEVLESFRIPMGRLTDKLAAALEIESESGKLLALNQGVSRMVEFARSLICCLDEPAPLVSITREVARLVGADSAAIWRLEQGSPMIRMAASYGLRSAEFLPLPVGQGLAGTVAATGALLSIEDAPADPKCIFPREARESGIGSYLGAAVKSEGSVIAVVEVHTSTSHRWHNDQQSALEAAAIIIAELVRTSDARGDRLKVESAYLGLSEALQRLRSRDEVLGAAVEVLGHALGVSRALIVEFGQPQGVGPVRHEYRLESLKSAIGFVFNTSLAERVSAAGAEPIAIGDSREEPLAGPEAAAELQILSELVLPVRVEDETCAIVYLHQSDRLRDWKDDEIEFADRVARQLGLSLLNTRGFEAATAEVQAALKDAEAARLKASTAEELQKRVDELERVVASSQSSENQTRTMLAHASGLEAKARAEADVGRRGEAEARHEVERLAADSVRARNASQQLLEINRLKSEFIVNAGREIDASLQSVLGLAEMLAQGSYGTLGPEQLEAVRGIYNWGRRVKSDVDWLIEYGSARSRRLAQSVEPSNPDSRNA